MILNRSDLYFMVLDRRGIKHGKQAEIGYTLGLAVLEEEVHLSKK